MNTFIYRNEKFEGCEFDGMTINEICSGPYVFRVGLEGEAKIYFAGIDDAVWNYLIFTGRIVLPITNLVDSALQTIRHNGKNLDDISNQKWKDLFAILSDVRKFSPNHLTGLQQKQESSLPDADQGDPRRAKFNSMMA